MSSTVTDNLSKEKLQQLLAAVGSGPTEDTGQIEAAEYNWRQPRYFVSEQINKLDDFTKKTAAAIARKFTDFYQSNFDVTITSTTQHFAAEFPAQNSDSKQDDCHLAFGTDNNHPFGLVSIPYQTAITWATQLLGDTESEKDETELC